MLNQDYTTKLLDLEDVIITNVENISDQLHISIELPRQIGCRDYVCLQENRFCKRDRLPI